MKKVATLILCCCSIVSFAQQSVSIGSTQTKAGAVLYLSSTGKNQGLIIPIVASRNTITGTGPEAGMLVFDDTDDALYYHDGSAWVKVGGISGAEIDGIIGNEVTQVNTTRGGLEVTGAGTAVSPLTVGIIQGTTNGQVLKWNSALSRWELGTDNTGTPTFDNTSIGLNGSSQLEVKNLGITTAKIADGAVTDTKVGTGISGSKINPNFAAQAVTTTGNLSAAAGTFSSNVNIRGLNYTWPAANATGVLSNNGTGTLSWTPVAAGGTVTSVGLALPSIFSVSGSPVTTTGTLTGTLASQATATVFAAPAGAAGAPSFRTLATTDIPALDATKISTGNWPFGRIDGAGPGVRAILGSDNNTVSWITGGADQLLGTDASGVLQFFNKSALSFITNNYIPRGNGVGMVSSSVYDDGIYTAIGRTTPVGSSRFDIETNAVAGDYGGMYITTQNGGWPFYGYSNGSGVAWTFLDGSDGNKWKLYNGGNYLTVTQTGDIGFVTTTPDFQNTFQHVNASVTGTDQKVTTISQVTAYADNSPGILEIAGASGILNDEIGVINFTNISSNSNDYNFARISTHKDNSTNDTYASMRFYTRAGATLAERMRINSAGLVGIGRVAAANILEVEGSASKTTASGWSANSDRRIKTSIQDIPKGMETILKLRPVMFKYTEEWKKLHPGIEDRYYYNFIAQEFNDVFPDDVKGSGEYLEGDKKEILQIDTYSAQVVLIKAVQELIAKTNRLEAENQKLRSERDTAEASKKANDLELQRLREDVDALKKVINLEAKKQE